MPQKVLERKNDIEPIRYNFSFTMGITCQALLLYLVFSAVFFLAFSTIYRFDFISSFMAFFSGCLWSMGNYFIIKGVDKIGISKTTIFMNSASIFTVILATIIFLELITISMLIGLPFLIVGALVVAVIQDQKVDATRNRNWKGYLYVIIGALFFSFFNIMEQEAVLPIHVPYATALPFFAVPLLIGVGAVSTQFIFIFLKKELKTWVFNWKESGHEQNLYGILGGVAWASGILITVFSNMVFGLSFTVPILQSFLIIFTSFWGIIFFKEIRGVKKLLLFCLGCVLSVVGVFFLSI
ncbi:MAG: GRP family sugar transporter [Candidatus Helarchaeota archaeon]